MRLIFWQKADNSVKNTKKGTIQHTKSVFFMVLCVNVVSHGDKYGFNN